MAIDRLAQKKSRLARCVVSLSGKLRDALLALEKCVAYKKFAMEVAERVAEAHKEQGGQVSDAERAAIEKISAALNPTPV